MAKQKQSAPPSRQELLEEIRRAAGARLSELNLSDRGIVELPEEIGELTDLREIKLANNNLQALPAAICKLRELGLLVLSNNRLVALPEAIGSLAKLRGLYLDGNLIERLPTSFAFLTKLSYLSLDQNELRHFPPQICSTLNLEFLSLTGNHIATIPECIGNLTQLMALGLIGNELVRIPESTGKLSKLKRLYLGRNRLTALPPSLGGLDSDRIELEDNPLELALASAYRAGITELRAYLRSLAVPAKREQLYEAKLVLVGEGAVGKTTLLKALTGAEPRANEPTTHGINIAIQAMEVPHPEIAATPIRLNAWDFGGQEVYRVTHQFFFSRRSIYLLVWEPRMGVQQCQVEDWLRLIRLRVGDDASVIIVSTHCRTGERIARIDQPQFRRDFGSMIAGFHEVDSLVDDPSAGDKIGVAELKQTIADVARRLEQMGMEFNRDWREARDELLALKEPRIPYSRFREICGGHGMDETASATLATLMHDLGYIVYYGGDERLKNDVVIQPEWLTKAIGFVLEDRPTQESEGLLPDTRLTQVWRDHPFANEPRYEPALYPFFLRLMEKYDVSYRIESGDASLVAQHVPQIRPKLPWLPEDEPPARLRRIALICSMEESPAGLVPWMIVRTHKYASPDPRGHRRHWYRGMFLKYEDHGEAYLEQRGREFQIYTQAVWPEYFLNVLRDTLQKLITDNWPGLQGRYSFDVPCPGQADGRACSGRFAIEALRQFLREGDENIRCQVCRTRQDIVGLLYGFEDQGFREQLRRIEGKLDRGFEETRSQIANSVLSLMQAVATESKDGPKLFTIEPIEGNWTRLVAQRYRLRLWCEAEDCQHPVFEPDQGVYEFESTREWVRRVAPYANLVAGVLKTVVPVVAPAVNVFFGSKATEDWGIKDQLELMKEATGELLHDPKLEISDVLRVRDTGGLTEPERSGVLALHSLLRQLDPNHQRLGLTRMATPTGTYLWLCRKHYDAAQSKIPDRIG